jgi:segregation and condensation protein A
LDLEGSTNAMEYQVELESFRGPLDLLLYLVKHNEVDVCDIPIARIAEQFLAYLNVIQLLDVDWAGEFIVMAATLTEIKSKLVLPRTEELTDEEGDPRLELVRQLVEYKKFKDAATLLDAQAEKQLSRLPRQPIETSSQPALIEQPLRRVELWDLVSAFGRLMRETAALEPRQIVMDDTPQHMHMERILKHLEMAPRLSFSDLFEPPHTRGRLLGIFLALLELIKSKNAVAEQGEPFGEIWICAVPAQPTLLS